MKQLFLTAALICSALVSAQYQNAPIDPKTNLVTYSKIVEVSGASASDLYARALAWVNIYYKDSREVIQGQDKESGKIIGKAMHLLNNKGGRMFYTFTISSKDGKVRIVIDNIYHMQLPEFQAQMEPFGKVENWVNGTTGLPKYITKRLPAIIDECYPYFVGMMDSMAAAVATTDEDW